MSLLFNKKPGGVEEIHLGDAWKPELEQVIKFEDLVQEDENGSGIQLIQSLNQLYKKDYQRRVTETSYGDLKCVHCMGEKNARERKQKQKQVQQMDSGTEPVNAARSYIYDPLPNDDAIRVLELQPASALEAPLHASLVIYPKRDNANYVALSYTWGGVAIPGTLNLATASLEITGNLDLALRALRPQESVLRIWVDAVCIDQTNLEEKGVQVARMDEIYAKATCVMAWLGPANGTSSAALENLEVLAELSKAPEYDKYVAPRPIASDQWLFPMDGDVATQIQELRKSSGINEVLDRLWFSRLWIVQEVVLAKEISLHIGGDSISWGKFCRALKMLYTADCQFMASMPEIATISPLAHAMILVNIRDRIKSMKGAHMIMQDHTLQVFGRTRDLADWGCQDERDRVYAILGMIPQDCGVRIKPDYTAEIRDICISFAREHILREGLLILLFAGLEHRDGSGLLEFIKESGQDSFHNPDLEKLGLPSWIPDVRPLSTGPRGIRTRLWNPVTFEASMSRQPGVVLHKSCPHLLAVRGRVFDAISEILPPEITRNGKTGAMDFLEAMIYLAFIYRYAKTHYEQMGGYPTGEDFERVFNGVVTTEKTTTRLVRMAQDRDANWIDENLEMLKRGSETNFQEIRCLLEERPWELTDIAGFFSALSLLFSADQCMLTEGGYMGIAPMCCRLDKIAWINGLTSPVILRPIVDGKQYQLVGPCFLYGLMHGELAARGDDEDVCTFIELI